MAVDRAAPRPVAEDRQAGGVRAGPRRAGRARPELELLGLERLREQLPRQEAADEGVEVERRGDDRARGPGPRRAEERAHVLSLALAVVVVAMDEGPR